MSNIHCEEQVFSFLLIVILNSYRKLFRNNYIKYHYGNTMFKLNIYFSHIHTGWIVDIMSKQTTHLVTLNNEIIWDRFILVIIKNRKLISLVDEMLFHMLHLALGMLN